MVALSRVGCFVERLAALDAVRERFEDEPFLCRDFIQFNII
jgi:hypothetical protein